jgi:hypothetical protein
MKRRSSRFRLLPLEDRVTPALTLSISPSTFGEAAGANAAIGTVTRDGDLSQAITVGLASSDTSEATVPASVTILANQASATFPIAAVDDTIYDLSQTVTISATVGGTTALSLVQSSIFGDLPNGTTRLPDGSLLVVGTTFYINAANPYDFVVWKFLPNGQADTSFGTNGRVQTNLLAGSNDQAECVAVLPDGKILVAGY